MTLNVLLDSVAGVRELLPIKILLAQLMAEFVGTFFIIFPAYIQLYEDRAHEDIYWYYYDHFYGRPPIYKDYTLQYGLCYGFMLTGAVESLHVVSGAHFNPCITMARFIFGDIKLVKSLFYIFFQLLGTILGYKVMDNAVLSTLQKWFAMRKGQMFEYRYDVYRQPGRRFSKYLIPQPNTNMTAGAIMGLEAFASFTVVMSSLAVNDLKYQGIKTPAGIGVGCAYAATYVALKKVTGACINPLRCYAPVRVYQKWTNPNHEWYWNSTMAGGLIAGILYRCIFKWEDTEKAIIAMYDTLMRQGKGGVPPSLPYPYPLRNQLGLYPDRAFIRRSIISAKSSKSIISKRSSSQMHRRNY